MIYEYEIEGLKVETGDLICTTDGDDQDITGQFWRLIGKLIPGEVDHIVIYLGPAGRCAEAGAKGRVILFDLDGHGWDPRGLTGQRGPLIDRLYGVAYPLESRGLDPDKTAAIRERVAEFCTTQAELGKPYNINFLNSSTDRAFYCSQLAYKAYEREGIDLNTGVGIPHVPGTGSIIFPQEIWEACTHRRKP